MAQIMWLKIVYVVVIASSVVAKKDELLDPLYGLEGGNKMDICVGTASGWRRCAAALLTREWLLARASCLAAAPPARLSAQQLARAGSCERLANGESQSGPRLQTRASCLAAAPAARLSAQQLTRAGSCERLAHGTWDKISTRQVYHVVMHPWFDLALAVVVRPYSYLDGHANATKIRLKLKPHGVYKWMKHYFAMTATARDQSSHTRRLYHVQETSRHPLWYFFMTMLLPSVLYMLFFIYITFYTGNTVPYKEKHYSKKVTHV